MLLKGYTLNVNEIRRTTHFEQWISGLKDEKAQARIEMRIFRLGLGLPGDVKPVGGGISEMRIDYGPGYRIYFCKRGKALIFLLTGGDKSTQEKDIHAALKFANNL